MKKHRHPCMSLKKAMEQIGRIGTCMVKMRATDTPEGFAYYLVPGGRISTAIADKIKARPDVVAGADGLFPDHDQTWRVIEF